MSIERIAVQARRLFLLGAYVLLALAVLEKIANLAGQTVVRARWLPSDLAWYGALLAVFAIPLLLTEIRKELGRG